jgi:BolA family transcriptional regulator, general stress-responsive regulator
MNRVERIRAQLAALNPVELQVVDDSHLHAGHAGARDGKGHFSVHIVTTQFAGLKPLARHQLVYKALADMLHSDIHALSIVAWTPDEAGRPTG